MDTSKHSEANSSLKDRALGILRGLSGRLLLLTMGAVMLAEVLIYVPSIANFRVTWLRERMETAQVAVLALRARPDLMVDLELEKELLRNAEVHSVIVKEQDRRELYLGSMPPPVDQWTDLAPTFAGTRVSEAFNTLIFGKDRVLGIRGMPRFREGLVEIVMDEDLLRRAMLDYSRNILGLSIVISLITALIVFVVLRWFIVSPILEVARNMVRFRERPEDASRIIRVSSRPDEIGTAEKELAAMQSDIRLALQQKSHLAALGEAVAKINHDLRNILASTQLVSDSLRAVEDPRVQRLLPRLVASVDRAIDLCTKTLKFGRAEEDVLNPSVFLLAGLMEEVETAIGINNAMPINFVNAIGQDQKITADREKLFRALLNLCRNAVQALQMAGSMDPEVRVSCQARGAEISLMVCDNGPGIPDKALDNLFTPFVGSARAGGTGLGLAIARELIEAHGGTLELTKTGEAGTEFEIKLGNQNS